MSKLAAITKPPRFKVEPPRMTILSDHPVDDISTDGVDTALPDNLELASRLSAIFDILRHKETRCPLTVAVYGDWGTGKTSAMKWLEGKLNEWNGMNNDRADGHPNVHPVWFEPWKYHTREDVWRGIISEVILAMFAVKWDDHQRLVNGLKEAAKSFGSFLGRSFLHALSALKLSIGDQKEISGEVFRDIYDEWEKVAQPQKPYLNQFESTLTDWVVRYLPQRQESIKGIKSVRTDRIVLFIDDLDRCLPEVTLEVLEAIKLYLSIKPLIFVCGLDRTVVDAVVKKRYKDNGLEDGHKSEHYLNKIFQVEVDVAPSETQVQAFLNHTLSSMNHQTGQYLDDMLGGDNLAGLSPEEIVLTARERLHSGLGHLARHNPREIKRLLNSALLRGRMAADNLSLYAEAKEVRKSRELKLAMDELRLPKHESGAQPLLFAQGVALYLLQRHFEGPYQLGREPASYLFRTEVFLRWLTRLSHFLCQHLDFEPPDRAMEDNKKQEDAKKARAGKASTVAHVEGVREEYEKIVSERPPLERGQTIPVACIEQNLVFSLLRIPFSTQVARSAPSSVVNSAPNTEISVRKLSPVLREAVYDALQKPRDESLAIADLRRIELLIVPVEATDQDLLGIQLITELNSLDLSGTQISNAGMVHVSKLTQLTSLDLHDTRVSDEGMVHVGKLTQLTSLNLNGTQVGNAGMVHLVKLTQLATLDLQNTQVGDEGMVHVGKLMRLTNLGLSRTYVNNTARNSLEASHPDINIW